MTIVEGSSFILAFIGIAFAFETPRRWFLRMFGLQSCVRETLLPSETTTPLVAISQITVREMVDTVSEAPPFQRQVLERQYAGIRIEWVGYLREVIEDPRNKSQVRVNLAVKKSQSVGYSFWFSLVPQRYPEIKTLTRNSAVRVIGTVLSVSGHGLCADVDISEIEVLERVNGGA